MYCKIKVFLALLVISNFSFSQEGIPVYSDYLSDNYYLIHPSMAGAANCDKIRLTARNQWFGDEGAPQLQTLSYNGRIGEKSGVGAILFNDKNGYSSQKGAKLTYAHHLMFSRDNVDLNQLSFGLSGVLSQSQLDQTNWLPVGGFDPLVTGTVQQATYFNVDFGVSYNFLDFYFHGTVQNAIDTQRKIYTRYESGNLRKFILSAGYVFGNPDRVLWEPSLMYQSIDQTKEQFVDVNIKAYKNLDFGKVWAVLSYRRGFDSSPFSGTTATQRMQYITPIVGANVGKFLVSYTYSYLNGDVNYGGSFHQLTLGLDVFCKREKYHCNCPAVN